MKNRFFFYFVGILLLFSGGHFNSANTKIGILFAQTKKIKKPIPIDSPTSTHIHPANIENIKSLKVGPVECWATIHMMKVMATLIKAGPPDTIVAVGFLTRKLQNSGTTAWKNITATATYDVKKVSPGQGVYIELFFVVTGGLPLPQTEARLAISMPGTYTLTAKPWTVDPGREFEVWAAVAIIGKECTEDINFIVANIPDVEINL